LQKLVLVCVYYLLMIYLLCILGMVAGGIASVFGTPAEVALIRMTSDGRLAPKDRNNYKHVFDALWRIRIEEGVTTLWRVRVVVVFTFARSREQPPVEFPHFYYLNKRFAGLRCNSHSGNDCQCSRIGNIFRSETSVCLRIEK
jgi:hypothetical protein